MGTGVAGTSSFLARGRAERGREGGPEGPVLSISWAIPSFNRRFRW
jgi:hypothetical protein